MQLVATKTDKTIWTGIVLSVCLAGLFTTQFGWHITVKTLGVLQECFSLRCLLTSFFKNQSTSSAMHLLYKSSNAVKGSTDHKNTE